MTWFQKYLDTCIVQNVKFNGKQWPGTRAIGTKVLPSKPTLETIKTTYRHRQRTYV